MPATTTIWRCCLLTEQRSPANTGTARRAAEQSPDWRRSCRGRHEGHVEQVVNAGSTETHRRGARRKHAEQMKGTPTIRAAVRPRGTRRWRTHKSSMHRSSAHRSSTQRSSTRTCGADAGDDAEVKDGLVHRTCKESANCQAARLIVQVGRNQNKACRGA